jgi:putative copper resistance protein D
MMNPVPAPTFRTVALDWHLDPAMAFLVLLLAALYLGGVRRLARRTPARHWPVARTVSFLAGLVSIVFATQSGLARYDVVLFSLHTVQHVLLAMVAPAFLALSAPITLALQASRRRTQATLARLLHHPVVRVLTHPVVAWVLFGGTLFALYFSPLFEASLRNRWLHQTVHLHFLLAGCLFAWVAFGIDEIPHRLPHPGRLLFVLLAVPFHAFLGLAVLAAADHPLGAEVYGAVVRDWGASLAADQRVGAGLLWAVGDLFGFVAGAIVLGQWIVADERRQRREDRLLDEREAEQWT